MKNTEKIIQSSDEEIESEPPTKRKRSSPFVDNPKKAKKNNDPPRGMLIVGNISDKADDKSLKKHFEPYGKILLLNILKHPNGQQNGCAFIHFETVDQAAEAILKTSKKTFLDRKLFVQWAKVNRKQTKNGTNSEIKSANDNDESSGDENNEDVGKKNKKTKYASSDVKEGCTVFITNVPLDADNDDVGKVCLEFGPIVYSIVTRDRASGKSKGTAFVKFQTKESADLCLAAGAEFVLNDAQLKPLPALSREQTSELSGRNLVLAKEGLILPGSKEAEGVSDSDMAKRKEIELLKKKMLKNLDRFVSQNRLSIYNLPLNYDNQSLRKMVTKHTGLIPQKCKVIREREPKDKTRAYGYISFTTQTDALTALKKLNNNPTIFENDHRPIVSFSINDRNVQKTKDSRAAIWKLKNAAYKNKLKRSKEETAQLDNEEELQKHIKKLEQSRAAAEEKVAKISRQLDNFVGLIGKKESETVVPSNEIITKQVPEKVGRQKRKAKC